MVFFDRYSSPPTLILLYFASVSFFWVGVSGMPSVSMTTLIGDSTKFWRFTSVATRSKNGLKSVRPSCGGYSFLR